LPEAHYAGIATGDLDGDGDPDVFASTFGAGARVLFNDGSGRLVDAGQRYGEDMSYKVALGDLNGDGGLDAFLANWRGSKVLLNRWW